MAAAPKEKRKASPPPASCLKVVDVCSRRSIFDAFAKEWGAREEFAMALACDKVEKVNDAAMYSSIMLV